METVIQTGLACAMPIPDQARAGRAVRDLEQEGAVVERGDKKPIADDPWCGDGNLRSLRFALDGIRVCPEEFPGLRFERRDGVGMPDDKLSLAANRVQHWWRVADFNGGQRAPNLFASVLVKCHDRAIGAPDQADQPVAVQQGMGGVTPSRRVSQLEVL